MKELRDAIVEPFKTAFKALNEDELAAEALAAELTAEMSVDANWTAAVFANLPDTVLPPVDKVVCDEDDEAHIRQGLRHGVHGGQEGGRAASGFADARDRS